MEQQIDSNIRYEVWQINTHIPNTVNVLRGEYKNRVAAYQYIEGLSPHHQYVVINKQVM